jgi:hypothetical protein
VFSKNTIVGSPGLRKKYILSVERGTMVSSGNGLVHHRTSKSDDDDGGGGAVASSSSNNNNKGRYMLQERVVTVRKKTKK